MTDSRYALDLLARFAPFETRMLEEGVHPLVINGFKRNYIQLLSGSEGSISKSQIDAPENVPDADNIGDFRKRGDSALSKTVVIKLNGGLGTSMGLDGPKSLLPVREGLSFLDIIARQMLHIRKTSGHAVPLVFMNSYTTRRESLLALEAYPELQSHIPFDFLQHRIPKVVSDDLALPQWENDPELEWCPPGHGDLYAAMVTSFLLELLLQHGYEYAFVSNSDNLGAVIDKNLLGYFAENNYPFMMEVADRTAADGKGGHLARLKDGRYTLRELAQCPEGEQDSFQDIELYRYFNTNNLWIHLPSLDELLKKYDNLLPLPLIRNVKTIDPRDPTSPKVFQMESAMGAAISLFEGSQAIRVPRIRFSPVKTTDDLLGLWSDAYVLNEDSTVTQNPARTLPTLSVSLDKRHYKMLSQLEQRFPAGAPSLLHCASLSLRGKVTFGAGVVLEGDVEIHAENNTEKTIADGSVVEGT